MKRIVRNLLSAGLILSMAFSCGCSSRQTGQDSAPEGEQVDIDLTALSVTVAYSQACQMTQEPQEYDGRRIRIRGVYNSFLEVETEEPYFYCQVPDVTGCCLASFEFRLDGEHSYPEDYPEEFDEIVLVGDFVTFDDDGYVGCMIDHAIVEEIL